MDFDPEQHEKNQQRYLEALLAAVEKHERENPNDVASIVGVGEAEMAKATGLSRAVVDRISDELSALSLLDCLGGRGPKFGRSYRLTTEGRSMAEKGRYERSSLAQRRKVTVSPEGKKMEGRPMLCVDRETARSKLEAEMAKGSELLAAQFNSEAEFKDVQKEYFRWEKSVYELIGILFTTEKFASEFRTHNSFYGVYPTFEEEVKQYQDGLRDCTHHLQSLLDRLDLIPEDPGITRSITVSEQIHMTDPKKVFVVHGHDNEAKESVARFLEKLGLKPIILHEQSDLGQTIIEKFETNANVGFAVVLQAIP